jgi:hypothetical protein
METVDGKDIAPEGQVWVCSLCGRRARSRWGFDAEGNSTTLDHGYDSSCMSHAVLCYVEKSPGSKWVPVPEKKPYSAPKLRPITDPDELERVRKLFGSVAV